jgi:hypothetical protein
MVAWGMPKVASSDATRRSQAMASSNPPPRAKPFTATTVGFGISITAS